MERARSRVLPSRTVTHAPIVPSTRRRFSTSNAKRRSPVSEAQHAVIDELEWRREDVRLDAADRSRAVTDLRSGWHDGLSYEVTGDSLQRAIEGRKLPLPAFRATRGPRGHAFVGRAELPGLLAHARRLPEPAWLNRGVAH